MDKKDINQNPLITINKFRRYVQVQASGVCNMWSKEVETLASLTNEEHLEIIKNYDYYEKIFDIHLSDVMYE